MPGQNKTPLVGWHPSADLVAWLDAEVERRGGGRGVRSTILEEALAAYKQASESAAQQTPAAFHDASIKSNSAGAEASAAAVRT